jgi:hypothetical protein
MIDALIVVVFLSCSIVPMICVVVWQVKEALDGGYYYSDETEERDVEVKQ